MWSYCAREGSGAAVDSGSVLRPEVIPPVQQMVNENHEEQRLQRKIKLRRMDGSHPSYLVKESATDRADRKRPLFLKEQLGWWRLMRSGCKNMSLAC